jgi:hypothetical protein
MTFKPDETFRGEFSYGNSPQAIRRFPFPFAEDAFQYSVNIEPHTPGPPGSSFEFPIDIDEHYVAECRERSICLATTRDRYLALPHMAAAQWDVLELIMTSLARPGARLSCAFSARTARRPVELGQPPAGDRK